jgi:hypothetical protein
MSPRLDPSTVTALRERADLARAVGIAADEAMRAGRGRLALPEDPAALPDEESGRQPPVHLRSLLQSGPVTAEDRALLGALLALDARRDPEEVASLLVWASARTDLAPLAMVDTVLPEDEAARVWHAVGTALSRTAVPTTSTSIHGDLHFGTAGRTRTFLLAITGYLFVRGALALFAHYALGFRRATEVQMTDRGARLDTRVLLLGRPVRETTRLVPTSEIRQVIREVRFARAGTYAGLVALVLGTYAGVTLVTDGFRAPGGSPTLVGLGLGIIALGLVFDFFVTYLLDGRHRKAALVLVPVEGLPLRVTGLDPDHTDALLRHLALRL